MIDFQLLTDRVKYIISHPARAWEIIKRENRTVKAVTYSFVMPVIILVSLSAFAGGLIYTHGGLSILFPVILAVKQFVTFYLSILLASWILNELSAAFIRPRAYSFNFKLVSYSLTPLMITMLITRLLPDISILNILGLYGAYIAYTGLLTLENLKSNNLIRYFIVALLTILTVYLAISWTTGSVLEGLYFAISGRIQ